MTREVIYMKSGAIHHCAWTEGGVGALLAEYRREEFSGVWAYALEGGNVVILHAENIDYIIVENKEN